MRVLICHRPGGAFGYISDGWINALRDKGHEVRRWNNDRASWDDFNPDIYMGCSGHKQEIPRNRRAKIAIHVNPWGPSTIDGVSESTDAINWVRKQKPDVVFGYGYDSDRILWSYWSQKAGITWVPMPTAGDKVIYKLLDGERKFDVVYLGGIWPYKAITITECLMPVLQNGKITHKLHGWGDWPDGISSGAIADDKVCAFFNSGKVGPCISEQHTRSFGIDLPERAFKVALCGALAVHDAVPRLDRIIEGIVIATTPEEYLERCVYYSRPENEEERFLLATKQRDSVLQHHTYHHRMSTMFTALGFEEEAEKIIE